MIDIIGTVKDLWEHMKSIFKKLYNNIRAFISTVSQKVNFNEKLPYNISMMLNSKKHRIRKKYAKRVFKQWTGSY